MSAQRAFGAGPVRLRAALAIIPSLGQVALLSKGRRLRSILRVGARPCAAVRFGEHPSNLGEQLYDQTIGFFTVQNVE
jgi:hypothetical protein